MLQLNDLTLRRGQRILFAEANLTVHARWKVGITGANGTGKSSLFSLLLGQLHHDTGDFRVPPQWTIAHVAQEMGALDRPAIDYVLDGDIELRQIERELGKAEANSAGERLGELHAQFEVIDGYSAPSRAARLLHGLGFTADQHQAAVQSFSGGWRMRLNLAQALMCRSDLLLLDEPTNHLDLDAVFWLEDWLRAYSGTLLLISHDRDFLDRTVDHIAHIEHQTIDHYSGNYSAFEKVRAERLAQQSAAYKQQQQQIAHMQGFVDRFRAKATKARQAQSRIKALERMQLIAPAHVDSMFQFGFKPPTTLPHPIIKLEKASAGYGQKQVLTNVNFSLQAGDRMGLLGPNGAGKSTLVKLLACELPLMTGKREVPGDLTIGYFAQHQLEQLRSDETPLWHMQRLDPDAQEKNLRTHLGQFGFSGDVVLDPVGPLSGGEKARLVLAMLVYQRPALLLLDEPTNHLDIDMRHALVIALQDFQGAMVIISHDRHLLRTATDNLLLVTNNQVTTFEGDLDDYRTHLAELEEPDTTQLNGTSQHSRKTRRRLQAQQRQQTQPLKKRIKQLEKAMDKLQTEKASILEALSDQSLYEVGSKDRLTQLHKEQGRIDLALEENETHWLEAQETLEQLDTVATP